MPRFHFWPAGLVLIVALAPFAEAQANRGRTVWDGIYTAAQAERGKEAYALHCSTCHSDDLSGGAGPALTGEQFMDNWREDSAKTLFTFIQKNMPQRARGSLGEQTYLDILSYIFSVSMFPAGSNALTADALDQIQIVGKDGPAPIPKFALVAMVGCLAKAADNEWQLEKVPAPRRMREEKPAAADVQASAARPLGAGVFRLVYIDSLRPGFIPESHVGHKLHAQGYLLSNEKGEGLSVTWLEAVASTCAN